MPDKLVNIGAGFRQDAVIPTDVPVNEDTRTVSGIVFSTGQRGLRYDWWTGEQYYEELEVSTTAIRTDRLEKGLSAIDNHRAYDGIDGVFGVTESYAITNGEIVGDVRFADDAESDVVYNKVRNNILRHVSLGYKVHRMLYVGDNEADGLPIYRATDWEPTELSFTPVSFETNNGVRSDDSTRKPPLNQCNIELEDESMRLPFQLANRSLYQDPEPGAAPAAPAPAAAPAAMRKFGDYLALALGKGQDADHATRAFDAGKSLDEYRQELANIQPDTPAGDTRKFGDFLSSATAAGQDAEHATRAFDDGVALADYNAELLAGMSARSQGNAPGVPLVGEGTDQRETMRNDFAAAFEARINGNTRGLTDAQRQYAYVPIGEAYRNYQRALGNSNMIGLHPLESAARALHTTSDLPLIFENVMNKTLLAAYEGEERTFAPIARRSTANDFREKHTYKMGDAPDLLPLGENGEYKYGTFSESKESYRIDTYARKIAFTRQMFINDDLSALSRFPAMFAQAGVRLELDIVWGLILNWDFRTNQAGSFVLSDGNPLFDEDHRNLLTGAGSALNLDTLSNIRALGRKQRTLDNKRLNVRYNTLAVGSDLETTAQKILRGVITPDNVNDVNVFGGAMDLIVEPRIDDIQKGSTSQFYFSNQYQAVEYSYLAGEEGLYTEVVEQTDVDATTMNVRLDFGAGFEDYRGAARAVGA